MRQNVQQTLAALGRMTPAQLRDKYLEVFGEPSRSGNKDFLAKRIAWRVQSLAEGGLSERARRRAEQLARDADIRLTIPRTPTSQADAAARTVALHAPRTASSHSRLPIPGTVLSRKYRGRRVEVKVLPCGFEYEGQPFLPQPAQMGRCALTTPSDLPWVADRVTITARNASIEKAVHAFQNDSAKRCTKRE